VSLSVTRKTAESAILSPIIFGVYTYIAMLLGNRNADIQRYHESTKSLTALQRQHL